MKHYCIGHKQKIELQQDWQWSVVKVQGSKRYICNKCIYCEGCKEYHTIGKYGGAKGYGNPIKYVCFKWSKATPPSMEKRIANLSPEEVMSGVHLGNERASYFKKDTNDWGKDHQKQKEELGNALSEI